MDNKIKESYKSVRKNYTTKLADSIIVATSLAMNIPLLSADKQLQTVTELNLLIYNI